jgi:hypothetical protein
VVAVEPDLVTWMLSSSPAVVFTVPLNVHVVPRLGTVQVAVVSPTVPFVFRTKKVYVTPAGAAFCILIPNLVMISGGPIVSPLSVLELLPTLSPVTPSMNLGNVALVMLLAPVSTAPPAGPASPVGPLLPTEP